MKLDSPKTIAGLFVALAGAAGFVFLTAPKTPEPVPVAAPVEISAPTIAATPEIIQSFEAPPPPAAIVDTPPMQPRAVAATGADAALDSLSSSAPAPAPAPVQSAPPVVEQSRPIETPDRAPASSDQVWVNTNSDVYHMPGMRWYGRTKAGYFTTEQDAIKNGYRRAMR